MMKQILLCIVAVYFMAGCGNDYYHDSGVANGKHDCSMWEYLQMYPETWDSVSFMIERANLRDIFDGTNPDYPEITFFGPTNYSVMSFLFKTENEDGERLYQCLKEIPVEVCRQMVLSHIIPQRIMKNEFDYEIKGTDTGGTIVQTLTGIDLRVYRIKSSYYEIPDIGPESLGIHALEKGFKTNIASADIQCANGVVHSLNNTYEMVEL